MDEGLKRARRIDNSVYENLGVVKRKTFPKDPKDAQALFRSMQSALESRKDQIRQLRQEVGELKKELATKPAQRVTVASTMTPEERRLDMQDEFNGIMGSWLFPSQAGG